MAPADSCLEPGFYYNSPWYGNQPLGPDPSGLFALIQCYRSPAMNENHLRMLVRLRGPLTCSSATYQQCCDALINDDVLRVWERRVGTYEIRHVRISVHEGRHMYMHLAK